MAITPNLSIDNNNQKQKAYSINIHCANCAAKIERKINELSDVDNATISILTKQLTLTAKNPDELLPTIQKIADKIEPGTIITQLEENASNYKEKIYLIENLDCANCGAKIEKKLNELPEIKSAQLTFATKKLKIVAQNPDVLLPQINKIANSIENGVKIINADEASSKSHQNTKKFFDEKTIDIVEIIFGAILFIIGEFTSLVPDQYTLYLYIVAYLILGFHVLKTAITNLFHGNVFDENFLMSIATLGAFAIKEYPEAVGVMLFYRIGEYFEERATEKSRSQIMDAVDLRPETVNLLHGDKISVISAHEAKVGDILLVRAGDRIPVDGIVIEGESRLDTSPVTGEPVPIKIAPNSSITSGCLNISGAIKMKVEKPLSESMVSRILQAVENAAANKPKIDKFITRFARIYTPIVVLVATLTAIIPSLITGDWEHWIYTALTFLVISCPCALVLSVPLAFFSGIGSGSKQGILFKGGLALEALKNIKTIVMDKTGTLTHGNFTVKTINPANNYTKEELLSLCASCEKISSHPIAISIINEATKQKLNLKTTTDNQEIAGEGIICTIDKQKIYCGNKRLMQRFNIALPDDLPEIFIGIDGKYAGSIVIGDTIKDDAKTTISKLKKLGLTTAMLTGDNEHSAYAVANEVGIDKVHAKLLPEDKLKKLSSLRQEHGNVFFVGDGINDAPILAGADVGAAMGSGADAAIEAADVVFMNSKVHSIFQAINISRDTIRIAWQNVVFALGVKILIMILGLMGFASMWAAVFADTGVAMICILNSIRILYKNY
jgi:Cd2+/Zn2+-exporting ATPase